MPVETMLKKKTNSAENIRSIALGVVGVVFALIYFYLVTTSPLLHYLGSHQEAKKARAAADAFFHGFKLNHSQFEAGSLTGLDRNLVLYAQYYRSKNGRFPDLSPGYRKFTWQVKDDDNIKYTHEDSHGGFQRSNSFSVTYNSKGELIAFEDNTTETRNNSYPDFGLEEAEFDARYFLSTNGLKTKGITVDVRESKKLGKNTHYRFVLKRPSPKYPELTESHTVELLGNNVISYSLVQNINIVFPGIKSRERDGAAWIFP
ncbi:MAG: hypothetical protein GY765_00785, partial [bacterium]|nr:hypothetical protein [bacterium]